jgi:thiamine pyrophosphokinase
VAVLVFANGDLESVAWVQPYLREASAIIAADGGAAHVLQAGFRPDLVIGDLDSFPPDQRAPLEAAGVRFVVHPEAKNETDLELALLHAAATSDEPVLVFAGLGGRLDQMLANVLLLMHPALRARSIRFLTPYQEIWLVQGPGVTEVRGAPGDTVSLIPLGGDAHIRATNGLAWSLQDETLAFGPARGISNAMTAPVATVEVAEGALLCVHTKQEWRR